MFLNLITLSFLMYSFLIKFNFFWFCLAFNF